MGASLADLGGSNEKSEKKTQTKRRVGIKVGILTVGVRVGIRVGIRLAALTKNLKKTWFSKVFGVSGHSLLDY